MADTQIRCPVCARKLAWRGLHGHLRFEHRLDSEAASAKLTEIKLEMRDSDYRDRLFSATGEYEEAVVQLQRIDNIKDLKLGEHLIIPAKLWQHMKSVAEKEVETAKILMTEMAGDWLHDRRTVLFLEGGVEALGIDQDDENEGGEIGDSSDG